MQIKTDLCRSTLTIMIATLLTNHLFSLADVTGTRLCCLNFHACKHAIFNVLKCCAVLLYLQKKEAHICMFKCS